MQTVTEAMLTPSGSLFSGENTTMCHEIDYRMARLRDEARRERLADGRTGLRQHVGHAIIAIGRAVHGLEAEPRPRSAIGIG